MPKNPLDGLPSRLKSVEIRYAEFPRRLLFNMAITELDCTASQKYLLKAYFVEQSCSFADLRRSLGMRSDDQVIQMLVPALLKLREELRLDD